MRTETMTIGRWEITATQDGMPLRKGAEGGHATFTAPKRKAVTLVVKTTRTGDDYLKIGAHRLDGPGNFFHNPQKRVLEVKVFDKSNQATNAATLVVDTQEGLAKEGLSEFHPVRARA